MTKITPLTQKEIKAQIKILESLKTDYYDQQEGLGGTYGDNYVGMKQISAKIRLLSKKLTYEKRPNKI